MKKCEKHSLNNINFEVFTNKLVFVSLINGYNLNMIESTLTTDKIFLVNKSLILLLVYF